MDLNLWKHSRNQGGTKEIPCFRLKLPASRPEASHEAEYDWDRLMRHSSYMEFMDPVDSVVDNRMTGKKEKGLDRWHCALDGGTGGTIYTVHLHRWTEEHRWAEWLENMMYICVGTAMNSHHETSNHDMQKLRCFSSLIELNSAHGFW